MTRPRLVLALVGIGALLALAGPFGTATSMPWPYRVAYWLCIPALTYGLGYLVHVLLSPWVQLRLSGPVARGAVILATGVTITIALLTLNLLVFGLRPSTGDIAILFTVTLLISVLIELLPDAVPTPAMTPDSTPPPLLARLPFDRRGPIVALSAEDHYTRVRTTRGDDLLLIRLADAMAEAAPTPGIRVHRSHWVALDQVATVRRDGERAIVTLRTGGDIPVSRSHMHAIRDAGLLPR